MASKEEIKEGITGITTEAIECFIDLLLLPFLWIVGKDD
jgi:hypothetical protein